MAEIVNLRRVKKQREAAAHAAEAQHNRVLHGRTKGEKQRDALQKAQTERRADQARLDPSAKQE